MPKINPNAVSASFFDRTVTVVTTGATHAMAATDDVIVVNKASGSATTVNLVASPATGKVVLVKDGKGDAATNNITISGNGKNIDGAATDVLNRNYGSAWLVYNGTQWNVLAEIATSPAVVG